MDTLTTQIGFVQSDQENPYFGIWKRSVKVSDFDIDFEGVESIAMDLKDKKLIVTGDIDPVSVVDKLRKLCQTKIVSIGPAKEPEKPKEQPKPQVQPEDMSEYLKARQEYYKQQQQLYDYYSATSKQPAMPGYYVESVEENPNACVICWDSEFGSSKVDRTVWTVLEKKKEAKTMSMILIVQSYPLLCAEHTLYVSQWILMFGSSVF